MAYWIVDRLLPGVVSSLIFTIPVWISHVRLRRHVDTVTERQTATLSGREPQNPGGTDLMVKHGARLWERHPAVRSGGQLSAGERAADFLKKWFGTWTALFGVGFAIAVWILLQKTSIKWDIYPFILLNLCLSCLAAVQGIILQISANRGDRISAEVALHTERNTDDIKALLAENTELTQAVKANTDVLEEIRQHVTAMTPQAGTFPPAVPPEPPAAPGAPLRKDAQ